MKTKEFYTIDDCKCTNCKYNMNGTYDHFTITEWNMCHRNCPYCKECKEEDHINNQFIY